MNNKKIFFCININFEHPIKIYGLNYNDLKLIFIIIFFKLNFV